MRASLLCFVLIIPLTLAGKIPGDCGDSPYWCDDSDDFQRTCNSAVDQYKDTSIYNKETKCGEFLTSNGCFAKYHCDSRYVKDKENGGLKQTGYDIGMKGAKLKE